MTHNPTRKGDLVAVVRQNVSYVIGRGNELRVTVLLAEVASANRDGYAKTIRELGSSYATPLRADDQVLVIPANVDRAALTAAYEAHAYAGHPNQIKPFDSADECRDFVRQFMPQAVTA